MAAPVRIQPVSVLHSPFDPLQFFPFLTRSPDYGLEMNNRLDSHPVSVSVWYASDLHASLRPPRERDVNKQLSVSNKVSSRKMALLNKLLRKSDSTKEPE